MAADMPGEQPAVDVEAGADLVPHHDRERLALVGVRDRIGGSALHRKAERVVGSQLAGLVVPYAQELRDLGVDETLLRELAELTGGSSLQEPQDAFLKARRRSRIAVEVWPWLVGFVALMMVPDIALRRVGPGALARMKGWLSRRVRRTTPAPQRGEEGA